MLLGSLLGWLAAATLQRDQRKYDEAEALRQRERLESERALARLRRELDDVVARARGQSEIFQVLPEVLGQMFSAQARRGVGPLALKLIEQLLHPEQCAVFVARPSQRCLALAAGVGMPPHLPLGFEVEYGQGRVGYVAGRAVAMDEADFRGLPLAILRQVDGSALTGLRPDVVVPIEQEGVLVGVLSVGGVRARHGHEKRVLKMVSDLTAVALAHVGRLRAADDKAHLDGLTGLANKPHFEQRLEEEIQRAEKEHVPLSLLVVDVDHFKAYNDANGHREGDEVLRKLGGILRTSVREDDVAARYEGGQFVVLYRGAGKALATRLANTLRLAVEAFPFPYRAGQPQGAVTVSGGVSTFPEDSSRGPDLIRWADEALDEAKAAGRNRIAAARSYESAEER